jgi:hypothetical protein
MYERFSLRSKTPACLFYVISCLFLSQIEKFHDDPRLWYYSQFAYYTFRLTEKWEKYYDEKKTELGWARPIVGIHIRRTDKIGTEAKFHSVRSYGIRRCGAVSDHYLSFHIG